jgi:hypothetical protein
MAAQPLAQKTRRPTPAVVPTAIAHPAIPAPVAAPVPEPVAAPAPPAPEPSPEPVKKRSPLEIILK